MAAATPGATPGLCGVRDKYLALLLSDVHAQSVQSAQSAPSAPSAPGAPPTWTPGGKFPFPTPPTASAPPPPATATPQHAWQSPVTPAPTDADVRLAELTAGLVAAGDNENRQAEAIRRLTGQLELSERRIRHLERVRYSHDDAHNDNNDPAADAKVHRHSTGRHRRASGTSHRRVDVPKDFVEDLRAEDNADEDHATPRDRHRDRGSARVSHRTDTAYTPSGTPRPQTAPSTSRRDRESTRARRQRRHSTQEESMLTEHRPSGSRRDILNLDDADVNRLSKRNSDPNAELEQLRESRRDWQRECHRYEKEATMLSKMFADFKRDMQRLVNERSDHLKVIARLQDQLATRLEKRDSSPVSDRQTQANTHASPPPASSPGHYQNQNQGRSQSTSPAPVGNTVNASPGGDGRTDIPPHELASVPAQQGAATGDETVTSSSCDDMRFMRATDDKRRYIDETDCMDNQHTNGQTSGWQSEREAELQEELQLVLQENARLSSELPALRAENADLGNRLHAAEAHLSKCNTERGGKGTDAVVRGTTGAMASKDVMMRLLEEVEILEGVSDAIHFGTADANHTASMTQISLGSSTSTLVAMSRAAGVGGRRSGDSIDALADRVAHIRSSLSMKYGQWLEVIGNQSTTGRMSSRSARSSTRSSRSSRDSSSRTPDITVESMNTRVVNRLIADS